MKKPVRYFLLDGKPRVEIDFPSGENETVTTLDDLLKIRENALDHEAESVYIDLINDAISQWGKIS